MGEQCGTAAPDQQNRDGSAKSGAHNQSGEVLSFTRLIARLAGDSLGRQGRHLVPESLPPGADSIPVPVPISSSNKHETPVGGTLRPESLCCSGEPPGPSLHASHGQPSPVRSCSRSGPKG